MVVVAAFVVYDLVTETVHDLNGTAGELLTRCDGATPTDDLVDEWATRAGTDRPEIERDVDAALAEFTRLGLVDRRGGWTPPPRLAGSTATPPDDAVTGAAHPALDRQVVFRSTDRALLDAIDGFLAAGTLEVHGPPAETLPIDVERLDDGSIRADVGNELHFPGLDAFLSQITSVINRLTAGPGAGLALHAGAVRSPVGEVVVVTAPSGSGKSTLVASLVQAGWDYLGDETIGVRPDGTAVGYPKRIGLDDASRAALGLGGSSSLDNPVTDLRADVVRLAGDVGPVSRTFLVEYLPGATPRIDPLNVQQGFKALLANTLTFGADAAVGLDTLCALATSTPVLQLRHSDARSAAALISDR